MRIAGGYYLKARKIQESAIAHAAPYVREIWDWLLKEANHKDNKYCGFIVKRGQLFRTYKEIREGLHWKVGYRKMMYSTSQIKKGMAYLRGYTKDPMKEPMKDPMIATTKELGGVLITILNYDKYQNPKNYERTNERTNEELMENHPIPYNNKNDKNEKNEKNNILYDFYVQEINPQRKSKQRAMGNIKSHLKHFEFEDLQSSILNYKSICKDSEPKFRKDPANFFGKNEPYFKDFLPNTFTAPENEDAWAKFLGGGNDK